MCFIVHPQTRRTLFLAVAVSENTCDHGPGCVDYPAIVVEVQITCKELLRNCVFVLFLREVSPNIYPDMSQT